MERYELRTIRQDEMEQGVAIELACFPPNEACSEKSMRERVQYAPELFLAAVDKETGKIAGTLNGLATNETKFRDAFSMKSVCTTRREKTSCCWVSVSCRNTAARESPAR